MSEVAAGTVIAGKYRVDEPIGQGGMASVWRATHLTLDAPVAIKLLDLSGSKSTRSRERFEREAKLAANIKHRNIVDILDFGVHDEEHPYMVMELLEGESLGDRIEGDEPLTDALVFDIGAQVLSGLAAAHDAGVVHRDVKPDNIFLVRDADGVYPKLLDFGISRDLSPDKNDTRVTSTGVLVGTPLYMSPEQARGLRDVDKRTDLWSVGAMLYEALSGDLPFDSENMGDILIRIAMEDMPPIQHRRPDLPDAAATVVMRALHRDRNMRWQDARVMRDALIAVGESLTGQAVRHHNSADGISIVELSQPGYAGEDDTSSGPMLRAPTRTRPKWPFALGAAALGFVAVAGVLFIALGGEVRFRGEAAQPVNSAAPPAATDDALAEVIPPVVAPLVEQPGIEQPSIEQPGEEAGAEEPSADEPSADVPSADEPSVEEPSVDEPSVEEPSVDEPSVDEPSVDEPAEAPTPRARPTPRVRRGASTNPALQPVVRPLAPVAPEPRPTPTPDRDVLRDLDY